MASIPLPNTTDKLQLVTAQAGDVHVAVFFAQYNPSNSDRPTFDRQFTAITTATTTDILAAPGSGLTRGLKNATIRNRHATDSQTVTVIYDANGVDWELYKVTLAPGEVLEWVEGVGWFVPNPSTTPALIKTLTADQSNSTTTPTEVTGLTLALAIGSFAFEYYVIAQSGATTTGHKFSVNFDGTETAFVAELRWVTAATTASDDVPDQDHVAAPGGVVSAYTARAKSTAGWGVTTDVDSANANIHYRISGQLVVTVAGNLELWHGSEAAAQSTVKAGTKLVVFP